MKKQALLILFVIPFLYFTILYFPLLQNDFAGKELREIEDHDQRENLQIKKEYQKQNITFLKFVSSENCMYSLDNYEIEELKKLNINGIRICPGYLIGPDGYIREEIPKEEVIRLIRKAHQNGFAVFLEVNFAGPPTSNEYGGFPHITDPRYFPKIYNISLNWAKIAEREKVEFFSPLNEPNIVFANSDLIYRWIKKSQDIKDYFSGDLVLKFADLGPKQIVNISKYDYLAFDIIWGDSNYEELKHHLNYAIDRGEKLKERYGLKGFFFGELGADRTRISKEIQAELFRTILEETFGKTEGYCFLGWSDLEFKFKDNEDAKEVIKNWYSKK